MTQEDFATLFKAMGILSREATVSKGSQSEAFNRAAIAIKNAIELWKQKRPGPSEYK